MPHKEVPAGFTAWVEYERFDPPLPRRSSKQPPIVARTTVKILDADDVVVSMGVAECSELDFFVKKIGREIATGRALKLFESIVT